MPLLQIPHLFLTRFTSPNWHHLHEIFAVPFPRLRATEYQLQMSTWLLFLPSLRHHYTRPAVLCCMHYCLPLPMLFRSCLHWLMLTSIFSEYRNRHNFSSVSIHSWHVTSQTGISPSLTVPHLPHFTQQFPSKHPSLTPLDNLLYFNLKLWGVSRWAQYLTGTLTFACGTHTTHKLCIIL